MQLAMNTCCAHCKKRMPRYFLLVWRSSDDPPRAGQLLRDAGKGSGYSDDVWGSILKVVKEETESYAAMVNARNGLRLWKVWTGRYRGYDPFCTLRCALAYARACYKLSHRKR